MTNDFLLDMIAETKSDHYQRAVMDRVQLSGDCWLWTGSLRGHYGRMRVTRTQDVAAHRLSYRLFRGPIPEGLDLDHLCLVPRCVNPDHLEAVTRGENVLRGYAINISAAARRAAETCKNGHPRTPENTRRNRDGKSACRPCQREAQRRYYYRTIGGAA